MKDCRTRIAFGPFGDRTLVQAMRSTGSAGETGSWGNWLPDMDLNHDKQIQSLLCYRYTIGQ